MAAETDPIEMLICVTCRRGQEVAEGGTRPGAILYEQLAADPPEGVTVRAVECLSNCSKGCTLVLRGPGRWTYVYGNFDERSHAGTIAEGAARYAEAPDGLVPWRQRPEHFRKNCIARVPPLTSRPPSLF